MRNCPGPTSWSLSSLLSNSCFHLLSTAMKRNRYNTASPWHFLLQPNVDDHQPTPPFSCPLGLSTSTSITLSQPDRYDIQLRGQSLTTILPRLGYTICLDLSYPFRPVFSVQTHQSHRTYTYTYFLFSLYLSISILVVVVCIPRGLARNPKSPNRISPSPHHTPKLKSKAYPYLFFLPPDIVQPCTLQIAVL